MKSSMVVLAIAGTLFGQTPPPQSTARLSTAANCASVSPQAATLHFETISVQRAASGSFGGFTGGPGSSDPGRIVFSRDDLRNLIVDAYGISWGDQIMGPDWIGDAANNGFSIAATMPSNTTEDQYCGMLRNLLASRLHLAFHHETRSRPSYELSVAPAGPTIKPYGADSGLADQPQISGSFEGRSGLATINARCSMSFFANALGDAINRSNGIRQVTGVPIPRVSDKTGLAGVYEFHLRFTGPSIISGATSTPTPDAPDLFNAIQQQLGLKLTKVEDVPVDVLIIDHADQIPTEN